MTQPHTILIVDDEEIGRNTLEALLYANDYQLIFADSGQETIRQVKTLSPDLILLDVMMPGMDGFETCQHLKSDDRWKHIPIILVTALDSKTDLARGFEVGADDFVSKPVNSLELQARVRSMLRLKTQFDELQTTLKLREDLANMIVHDMRSPLTAILGVSELLQRKLVTSDSQANLQILQRQVLRLQTFINDLLTMAKMDAGNLILNREPVDINQLILELKEGYDVIAHSKGLTFLLDLPPESRWVSLDTSLFQRVLDNLLSNAMKFSTSGDEVTLKLWYLPDHNSSASLQVQVIDQGVGIPESKRQQLFEMLDMPASNNVNVPEAATQVGFGLTFCKMVIDAHGGHISVEANHPKGTIVIVEI